jgi:hypothetical protein
VLRRPFLQLITTAFAFPDFRLRGPDGPAAVSQDAALIPVSDIEGRIGSVLPVGWYLTPLTGHRLLDMEDESGEAQIYFRSYHETQYGPFPDTMDAYVAHRTSELADSIELLTKTPLRHLLVGGRPAVQLTAKFWWREEGRSFGWTGTYIDAGDRRDEVVGSDRYFERTRPAVELFLQRLKYR